MAFGSVCSATLSLKDAIRVRKAASTASACSVISEFFEDNTRCAHYAASSGVAKSMRSASRRSRSASD
jgi:hypothetical protein